MIFEFIILVLPFIISVTLSEWTHSLIFAQSAFLVIFQLVRLGGINSSTHSEASRREKSPTSNHLPFLVAFRSYLQLLTVLAILAVDFHIFPRKFAKVETFGTSLMDLGVGAFIFSGGIVAGPRLLHASDSPTNKLKKTIRQVTPTIFLGLVRLVATKSVNYQEHVSEYGIHWNFFFTLSLLPVIVTFQSILLPRLNFAILAATVIVVYQTALSRGMEAYIINAPRVDLLSMNREGICSLAGYYSIFLISAELSCWILPSKSATKLVSNATRTIILSTSFACLAVMSYLSIYVFEIQVSRRMVFHLFQIRFNNSLVFILTFKFLLNR